MVSLSSENSIEKYEDQFLTHLTTALLGLGWLE